MVFKTSDLSTIDGLGKDLGLIPSDYLINQIWLASYMYPSIAAASELGLPAQLVIGVCSVESISKNLNLNFRATEILLEFLVSLKMVQKTSEKNYALTIQGQTYLAPKSAYSWKGMFARELGNPIVQQIILAARAPEQSVSGLDFLLTKSWKEKSLSPEDAKVITESMDSENAATARIQAKALDLSKTKKLLDLGGGSGVFAIAFAERNQHLLTTVADLAPVVDSAQLYIQKSPAQSRVSTIKIDFFRESWPTDFDSIFLSNILHDWDEETIRFLVKRAFDSLPIGGTLIINEMLTDETSKKVGFEAHAFSIVMLTRTLGQQMSFSLIAKILSDVGFDQPALVEGDSIFSLVVARKGGGVI